MTSDADVSITLFLPFFIFTVGKYQKSKQNDKLHYTCTCKLFKILGTVEKCYTSTCACVQTGSIYWILRKLKSEQKASNNHTRKGPNRIIQITGEPNTDISYGVDHEYT